MSDTSAADSGGFDPGRLRTAPTQMLRSRDDRYIAGVCGGLARYLNIDPVVVRVLLAALTVVGGVGLVLYAAAWLLAPEEGNDKSLLEDHLPLSPRYRVIGWIVAGTIAAVAVVGSGPWFDWGWIGPLPLLGLAVLIWVLARPRATPDTASTVTTSPPATPSPTPSPTASTATTMPTPATPASETASDAESTTAVIPTGDAPTTPLPPRPPTSPGPEPSSSATVPPPAPAPAPSTPPPPRVPRPDATLTLLTLAALAAVVGLVRLLDQTVTDVDGPVYLGVSIAVVAAGMLAGTWWGNGRWLIPIGAALTMSLIIVSQLPVWKFGEINETPKQAADVRSTYEMGAGEIDLDLTQVEDLAALDGRTIHIDNGLGQTRIRLPDDLDVTVVAEVNGGDVDVLGREASGSDVATQFTDLDDTDPDLRLEIDGSFGQVEVTRP